jgi:hypothetical protein
VSNDRERSSRRSNGRQRRRKAVTWWCAVLTLVVLAVFGARPVYHFLKAKRAEQFVNAGDVLVQSGKWNEAAKEYRAALQLDPFGYHPLVSAARLAARVDRPEAVDLWQEVMRLPQCTVENRQEYVRLLLRVDRLNVAERVINGLLKTNPDTSTLELASQYARKIGDNAKALELARTAVKRAPDDDLARFQLADLLAQSTDSAQQAEARKVLWELAGKDTALKKPAIEALARAPELTADERERVLHGLAEISPKNLMDDVLAADVRIQIQPDDASRIYDEMADRWRNGKPEELVVVARWLNARQQAERVLRLCSIERALKNNDLLLARLDALAILQRWADVEDTLTRPDLTLDPPVIESFRARTAQERGAVLDAEVHWNHAISLAGTDPFKLRFVASFAEQSRANAAALKAYQQLARFPQHARIAYAGAERVAQRTGDASAQRSAAEKVVKVAPDDPNAAGQLAYLNLLLENDVDKNLATAKTLAQKYPSRLSYRVTAALGYLRQHDAGLALAQFNAPAPIDWKQAQPAWRAVYAAALFANERNDEARQIIMTIPLDRLNPQERALIEPAQ